MYPSDMETTVTGTIEEVLARYSGKWLVLEIVRHDSPALEPQEVRVMAATDDEATASRLEQEAGDPLRHMVVYAATPEERESIPIVLTL